MADEWGLPAGWGWNSSPSYPSHAIERDPLPGHTWGRSALIENGKLIVSHETIPQAVRDAVRRKHAALTAG